MSEERPKVNWCLLVAMAIGAAGGLVILLFFLCTRYFGG